MQGVYEHERDNQPTCYFRDGRNTCRMHFHKQIEILHVSHGEMEVRINDETFNLLDGDFVFCNALDVHSYKPNTAVSQVLTIPVELLRDFYTVKKDLDFSTNYLPKCECSQKIFALFTRLAQATHPLLKSGLANELLYEIISAVGLTKKAQELPNLTRDIIIYLNKHITDELSLSKIASEFSYSPTHFSHLFNSLFATSFSEYVNNQRIEKLIVLKNSNPSSKLTRLAFDVGFCSLPTFYRAFEKAYGVSPSTFFSQKDKPALKTTTTKTTNTTNT